MMSRRIVTTQLDAVGAGVQLDTYFDKLIKYIPADIVAAWTAATGLIAGATDEPQALLLWIAFAFGVVVTAVWTLRQTAEADKPPAVTQTAISTIAFGVWVFALGGPFANLGWYSPLYGSLLLIAFTLAVPLINPTEG
jgi:hypothetical protein